MPGFDLRIVVLHIDRDTDLPLHYTYEAGERTFRTMGYVRLGGSMVPFVEHAGPDTPTERDRFLLKVLHSVLVPDGAARRVVRHADHLPDTGPTAGPATAHDGDRTVALLALWGLVAGLVAGVAVGGLLAGWTGAVIGAFVGASTFADLVAACWQLVHRNSPSVVIETHDLLAIAMVAGGSAVGGPRPRSAQCGVRPVTAPCRDRGDPRRR